MKTYNVNYKINLENNYTYIILSDFHGYFNLKLAKQIKDIKADYIIITGDILNGWQWNKNKYVEKVKNFIKIISETHKVIISLGNHDLWHIKDIGFKNFKSLKDENVFPIFNETCVIDNNSFTSFVPDKTCYNYFKQDDIETINKIVKTLDTIDHSNKYVRHLVSHNPYHFYHNQVMKHIISKFDIIETGHLHDGYIPTKYLHSHYDKVIDKGLHEVLRNIILKTKANKTTLKHKRILSRGVIYMYENGYYVILPNNSIFYYDKNKKEYQKTNITTLEKALEKENVQPLVVTGAINTCMRLNIFYPYITCLEITKNKEFKATAKVKKG